jgi:hypothetical protein
MVLPALPAQKGLTARSQDYLGQFHPLVRRIENLAPELHWFEADVASSIPI